MSADLKVWLTANGLGKYAEAFEDAEIDFQTLALLGDEDLKELGLPLGPRRKLQNAMAGNEPAATPENRDASPRGEHRQVTVLFVDLCDFTGMTSRIGPEATHALLNKYFDFVDTTVSAYGGKIDKHIGDAVLAVFGAPIARTDDSERALRAAFDIIAGVAALTTSTGESLAAHIGIASGQVVASRTGSATFSEYTVTGETVNLASRLQDKAEKGQILISEAVHGSTDHIATTVSRGEIMVEGFGQPVRVWQATAIKSGRDLTSASPFVGRERECRQFEALADATARHGHGHTILVRGEPGIGKTRLVETFIGIAENRGFSAHRGYVLDFGTGRGQGAIGAILRSLLDVSDTDSDADRRAAAQRARSEQLISADHEIFLNDLLDLPQSLEQQGDYDAMEMDRREEGKRATFAQIVERISSKTPLVLLVEDIHWADSFTLACLVQLTTAIPEFPVVLILNSRVEGPSDQGGWATALMRSPMTTMELQTLSSRETLALAEKLAAGTDAVIEKLVARSEGNPLFLEQLVRNVSGNSDDLPGTIQGLVLARMDRLESRDREALQSAAVIGQSFALSAVRSIMLAPDYDPSALLHHKMIRPRGSGFVFDHALIRDAVYSSLLTQHRQELHARAATYFSGSDPVLHAEHLERAGDPAAALAYLEAAEMESAAYRVDRAVELAERGLAITTDQQERFSLMCRLGEWQLDMGDSQGAKQTFTEAAALGTGDPEFCRVNLGLAAALRLTDNQQEALELLDSVEDAASRSGLESYLGQVFHLRGNLNFILGNIETCRQQHQMALDLAVKIGARDLEARALGGLADVAYAEGKMHTAYDRYSRCVALAEELGLGRVAVANRSMTAVTRIMDGDVAGALESSLEAIEAAKKTGQDRALAVAHHGARQALWACGKYDDSEWHTRQSLALAKQLGAKLFEAEALVFLVEVALIREDEVEARRLASEALDLCRKHGMSFVGPVALGTMALVTDDDALREKCLSEGESLLAKGSLSHNHFWFYRDAMETMLETGNWAEAERYATALETYTATEPMEISDFLIGRARALAAFGRGERSRELLERLRGLHELAARSYVSQAQKIESALEKFSVAAK